MRCRAFLPLVASVLVSLPFVASAVADAGIQVSGPIVHDNLAIYLVHGSGGGGAVPLTLQEALAKGVVKVHETGSVNALTVENIGKDEVFVQAGDIVKGGQQDRVLSVDLLLPPRSGEVSIAAFCVEHGRWTARGNEDVRQFASAAAAMPSREAKVAMRSYAVARRHRLRTPPRGLWPMRAAPAWDRASRKSGRSVTQDAGQLVPLGRRSGRRASFAVEPATVARKRKAQAGSGSLHRGAARRRRNRRRHRRLRFCHQRQDQQRRRLCLERAVSQNVEQAFSRQCHRGDQRERGRRRGAPPPVKDVEAFLATASTGVKAERAINASVRLATHDGDTSLYAETRRTDGSWVHRNYLAK